MRKQCVNHLLYTLVTSNCHVCEVWPSKIYSTQYNSFDKGEQKRNTLSKLELNYISFMLERYII